jgi:hypothetical protein
MSLETRISAHKNCVPPSGLQLLLVFRDDIPADPIGIRCSDRVDALKHWQKIVDIEYSVIETFSSVFALQ